MLNILLVWCLMLWLKQGEFYKSPISPPDTGRIIHRTAGLSGGSRVMRTTNAKLSALTGWQLLGSMRSQTLFAILIEQPGDLLC